MMKLLPLWLHEIIGSDEGSFTILYIVVMNDNREVDERPLSFISLNTSNLNLNKPKTELDLELDEIII